VGIEDILDEEWGGERGRNHRWTQMHTNGEGNGIFPQIAQIIADGGGDV
jgi:hypothetical protein